MFEKYKKAHSIKDYPSGSYNMSKESIAKKMFQVCECGDYRHQHEEGKGKCIMPNNITHGYKECTKFRNSNLTQGQGLGG